MFIPFPTVGRSTSRRSNPRSGGTHRRHRVGPAAPAAGMRQQRLLGRRGASSPSPGGSSASSRRHLDFRGGTERGMAALRLRLARDAQVSQSRAELLGANMDFNKTHQQIVYNVTESFSTSMMPPEAETHGVRKREPPFLRPGAPGDEDQACPGPGQVERRVARGTAGCGSAELDVLQARSKLGRRAGDT